MRLHVMLVRGKLLIQPVGLVMDVAARSQLPIFVLLLVQSVDIRRHRNQVYVVVLSLIVLLLNIGEDSHGLPVGSIFG